MSTNDLQKHLNHRVCIRVQNIERTLPGFVKLVDGSTLTLQTVVAGKDTLQCEDTRIPCEEIVSILFDEWR